MSAAAIAVPPAQPRLRDAPPPVPFYTRHMLGAIEADRDERRQGRDHAVPRVLTGR